MSGVKNIISMNYGGVFSGFLSLCDEDERGAISASCETLEMPPDLPT